MMNDDKRLNEQFVIRITKAEAAVLDQIKDEGGYRSRNELVRSILRAIIDDEKKAEI